MAEPVSSAGAAALAGLTSGVVITALRAQVDPGMVVGVVCGAFVYLMRSHEPSRWRKAVYFVVSLVGGYYLSLWATRRYPELSAWLVGFAVTASIVTVAVLVLDWVERNIQPTLDALLAKRIGKLPGGKSNDDSA
jgi:MFS superfamily sulfate permease-like transporter